MLVLLALSLGAPGAASFVLQLATWCPLSPEGSLVATNSSVVAALALGSVPVVCANFSVPESPQAVPCPGPLSPLGDTLAKQLNQDPRWARRMRERLEVCRELPRRVWPPRTAAPRGHISAWRSGDAARPLALSCQLWGFAPAAVSLRWLRDGRPAGDCCAQPRVLPAGDGTFRAEVTIQVTPEEAPSYECFVGHPALREPMLLSWAPRLSPALSLQISLAVVSLVFGILLFAFGLRSYLCATPLPPGYSPLPGDTYAGSI